LENIVDEQQKELDESKAREKEHRELYSNLADEFPSIIFSLSFDMPPDRLFVK